MTVMVDINFQYYQMASKGGIAATFAKNLYLENNLLIGTSPSKMRRIEGRKCRLSRSRYSGERGLCQLTLKDIPELKYTSWQLSWFIRCSSICKEDTKQRAMSKDYGKEKFCFTSGKCLRLPPPPPSLLEKFFEKKLL